MQYCTVDLISRKFRIADAAADFVETDLPFVKLFAVSIANDARGFSSLCEWISRFVIPVIIPSKSSEFTSFVLFSPYAALNIEVNKTEKSERKIHPFTLFIINIDTAPPEKISRYLGRH